MTTLISGLSCCFTLGVKVIGMQYTSEKSEGRICLIYVLNTMNSTKLITMRVKYSLTVWLYQHIYVRSTYILMEFIKVS